MGGTGASGLAGATPRGDRRPRLAQPWGDFSGAAAGRNGALAPALMPSLPGVLTGSLLAVQGDQSTRQPSRGPDHPVLVTAFSVGLAAPLLDRFGQLGLAERPLGAAWLLDAAMLPAGVCLVARCG